MLNQKNGGGKSKAKTLGNNLMYTAYFEYDRHSKTNGYTGFKDKLVNAGAEDGNAQGANVYGHILFFAGAYLDGSNIATAILAWGANEYDHGQIITGNNKQAPSEAAGNSAGTEVGKHIWNYLTGTTPQEIDRLKKSLTSELCEK